MASLVTYIFFGFGMPSDMWACRIKLPPCSEYWNNGYQWSGNSIGRSFYFNTPPDARGLEQCYHSVITIDTTGITSHEIIVAYLVTYSFWDNIHDVRRPKQSNRQVMNISKAESLLTEL